MATRWLLEENKAVNVKFNSGATISKVHVSNTKVRCNTCNNKIRKLIDLK